MKTLSVKPVFVKSKLDSEIGIYQGKVYHSSFGYTVDDWENYQLILISLDPDEKIEVGDVFYSSKYNTIDTLASNGVIDKLTSYKVIATQDQLSPEHIQQLVDEYNNGGMQDFEIEMAVRSNAALGYNEYVYLEHIKNKSYLPIKIDANINQDSYQLGKEEEFENWEIETYIKLTNGFVTVVNKLLMSTETNSDAFDRGFVAGENSVRERLEAVLYNESEVLALCNEAYNLGLLSLKSEIPDLDEMMELDNRFNKNKKK